MSHEGGYGLNRTGRERESRQTARGCCSTQVWDRGTGLNREVFVVETRASGFG